MSCDRFDREGWIDGEELDEEARAHVEGCSDCRARLESSRRITRDLSEMGERHRLRPDARAKLWEAIERREAPTPLRGRSWRSVAFAAAAIAAAVALALALMSAGPPRIEYQVIEGNTVRSGADASVGDRLRVTAEAGRFSHASVRVYRDRATLIAESSAELRLEVALDAPGTYELVLLASDRSLPEARSVDEDVAAAVAAGARYELRDLEVH